MTRRMVLQGAGVGAIAAFLAACGVGSGGDDAAQDGGDGEEIDLLTVGFPASLTTLYPGKEGGVVNYYIAALIAEGLLAPDGSGKLQPALAEKVEQPTPDVYRFTIRKDAKFNDGSSVTVDDVLNSIEMARSETTAPGTSYAWGNVKSVEKDGDDTIVITLNEPDASFEWVPVAANALWVVPKAWAEANGDAIGTPQALLVGTGPYKVTKFVPDESIELERVDTWWGGSVPAKKVRIDFIPDESTRLLARQSGDIDIAISISLDQANAWESAPDTTVYYAPNRSYVGIDFFTPAAPFDDIHVRRAIAYACDRESFVKELLHGHGVVATALTTPEQLESVYDLEGAKKALAPVFDIPFDMEKAREELSQSSVPDGFTTKVGISNSAPQVSAMFQVLKQTVEPLGIIIEIEEMPVERWYGTIGSADWPLAYMDYTNTTGDPADMCKWFLSADGPSGGVSQEIEESMAAIGTEMDAGKRAELLIETQKKALEDIPYIPLWWGEAATAVANKYTIKEYGANTFSSPWTSRIVITES